MQKKDYMQLLEKYQQTEVNPDSCRDVERSYEEDKMYYGRDLFLK
jgi:hypothetical protein